MSAKQPTLKEHFLEAFVRGELGTTDHRGTVVTLKEFKHYFSDIQSQYVASFLPSAAMEPGQHTMSQTKFVFRLKKGIYLVHPDALRN